MAERTFRDVMYVKHTLISKKVELSFVPERPDEILENIREVDFWKPRHVFTSAGSSMFFADELNATCEVKKDVLKCRPQR